MATTMRHHVLRSILVLAVISQLTIGSFAQQPQTQRPATPTTPQRPVSDDDVVRITTNLVQVDPVITDKNDKQVTDLRPDEVQILEDGKPQKITNFSYVALEPSVVERRTTPVNPNAPPIPPVRLKPEQVRRTIALVVDDLGLSFESSYYVRRALKQFLDKEMQPDDLVAIIRTGGGIGALQQFTSDKRQLYAAVEKVRFNLNGRSGVSPFAPIEKELVTTGDNPSDPSSKERFDQFREDLFAVGTLGAVNYIVRGLRTLPGRKSVVLLSDGFKIFSRSDPTGNPRVLNALKNLTDLANRASVVIYTIDARGLVNTSLNAADSVSELTDAEIDQALANRNADFFESQSGLNYLARQTGGFAVRNSNDINHGIRRVLADQQGYYLIGYRPDESTFDPRSGHRKFHKLSVKVLRPGSYKIRMRNGFYGFTDEEARPTQRTAAQQLMGALTSPFGVEGVHVRLTSLFANDAKIGSILHSMLHVRGSDLTFVREGDTDWHKAVFDIVAVTFGDNGAPIDQVARTHTMRIRGDTYKRVLADGFTYNLTVRVKKAGAYQLRTAIRDVSSERLGSATQFVEVPDIKKNRLLLSGLIVRGTTFESYQKDVMNTQNEAADDTVNATDPKATAAVRQFKQHLVMIYSYAVYNAQLSKATGKPELVTLVKLFRDGKEVFTGKETPFDPTGQPDVKRLMVTGAIQLGSNLTPGEYVLQVVVTDMLSNQKNRLATQWIDFEITK